MFVGIGVIAGLATLTHMYMFNTAGVKMTTRLRQKAFKSMINQEVAYFDDDKNSVGALCARLAGDCAGVQGVCTEKAAFKVRPQLTQLALCEIPHSTNSVKATASVFMNFINRDHTLYKTNLKISFILKTLFFRQPAHALVSWVKPLLHC